MASNLFDHKLYHVPSQATNKRTHASKLSRTGVGPKAGRSQLGVDFQPSDHSVICGRGRQHSHAGNRRFRALAKVFVKRYSQADSKTTKAAIVLDVLTMIREAGGNFCRYEQGAWFEVGNRCVRGKVSACFRDILHTQYRSSAKAKTSRRSILNRKKTQTQIQLHFQQLLNGSGGHCWDDASSMSSSSSCSRSSTDSLGFDHSLEIDFFDIDVF
jgi:hypothetical protein